TEATAHLAHRLAEAPAAFRIAVDPDRAARELIPVAVAAGTGPREDVLQAGCGWRRRFPV
ncbi:MAG: hypothetical protein P8079_06025, partial [Gammaproteobacteria bacterium]